MELSKRLHAVASLVTEGASVADVGTDHGYIPIYLAKQGISPRIIAMDVNEGPLKRAASHIRAYHMEAQIETRLSDGVSALAPGEADTIITAGMGGALVIKILTDHPELTESIKTFILQPQSEIGKVRRFLCEHGFVIIEEDMVKEDGKYYPMMKVVHGTEAVTYEEADYLYGKLLLEKRHPVLREFLEREWELKMQIVNRLKTRVGMQSAERIWELEQEAAMIQEVLSRYFN